MEQAWFELHNARRRKFTDAVWIPLYGTTTDKQGEWGHLGHKESFFGVGSVALPVSSLTPELKLNWDSIGLHDHGSYASADRYKPADVFWNDSEQETGISLVLSQHLGSEPSVLHLHQDLVISLGLKREGDSWVRPAEGYVEVVRLKRDSDGCERLIEIKAEFLRDYLAARKMALRLTCFWSQRATLEDVSHISWHGNDIEEKSEDERFIAGVRAIHEGSGHPYGSEAAVTHAWRTDVDEGADVPVMGPEDDDNTDFQSWSRGWQGRKVYYVFGECWRNEWIMPSEHSPRVRGDELPSTVSFIVDASGKRESAEALDNEDIGKWLWFQPALIDNLLARRGWELQWYTRDTGGLKTSAGYNTHFGINPLGFVNVYAYDVARLPEWQRRIWMGFNVAPEGGISSELHSSQVRAVPASTEAPEELLPQAIKHLDDAFHARWGVRLFKSHVDFDAILSRTHRFRALDQTGFYALAKDLARLTLDSFNVTAFRNIVQPPAGENWGSRKLLEAAVATVSDAATARRLLGSLAGLYDLRLADAHMPATELDAAFSLVSVNKGDLPIMQGTKLLENIVTCIAAIAQKIEPQK